MKKTAILAAVFFCLWQIPAAANGQMDYLAIENRIQDEWTEYTYSYPQVTRSESRVTEQRLNGFLREYSQSTALNARLLAKKEARHIKGQTTFAVCRNDNAFFSLVFSSLVDGKDFKKGFVFLPQNGVQLRLEDLFSSPAFPAVLEQAIAGWREALGVWEELSTLQDFYLTGEELVLLFPSPDGQRTLSVSIPLKDLSGILSESLLSFVS
ncbi:MAG: hypothetical protein PHE47_04720 [Oscillospiraceae bacterium]|nr:hypothetical protein [Oscillospiraceae bacterium]